MKYLIRRRNKNDCKDIAHIVTVSWNETYKGIVPDWFLEELKNNENVEDDKLPLCTDEERWKDKTKYAVKKIKNKTATKLHDSYEDAKEHLDNLEKDFPNVYEIEVREGQDKKCLEYCSCCKFCSYWKENYGKKELE